MVNDHVVVIGRYVFDANIALDTVVLEIGGNAEQVKGNIVSAPMDNQFLILTNENGDMVVELQTGTKFFDANGEIGTVASEVTVGTIDDLALGQMVDLFGLTATDSCFDANEVIVDVVP